MGNHFICVIQIKLMWSIIFLSDSVLSIKALTAKTHCSNFLRLLNDDKLFEKNYKLTN